MLNIISLGAGVQSSTMALMVKHHELPMVDAAIFADTGWEGKRTYDFLSFLEKELPFPVYRVSAGNLRDKLSTGWIPAYTEGGGGCCTGFVRTGLRCARWSSK